MGFRHHTSMKWCMGACRCCLLLLYLFVYILVKRWSISLHDAPCGKNEAPKWCLKKNFVKQYPWRRKVTGYMFFFPSACDVLLILWMKSKMYFSYQNLLMKNVQVHFVQMILSVFCKKQMLIPVLFCFASDLTYYILQKGTGDGIFLQ